MDKKNRRLSPGVLIILLFCFATLAQFAPVLLGHGTLSKVHQLAEWDSFFDVQRSGHSMLMDPSLVYLMMPYYLLKSSMISSGNWPLWNPYSGLGCPLLADPQALAFSPLHIPLILNPGLVAYNQVLVLEILILGLSTFGLARSLKLGLPASTFAMLCMAFCPFERWYLELLGNGYCFIPLAFWAILSLRSHLSAVKIWLVGLACALMVLSAHPELSFFSIGLASLTLLLIAAGRQRVLVTLAALACSGAIAFMFAAPMLVPFLEFLRNSDSYKFGSGAPAVVPWQTLIFNLLQPGFGGASPTLGPCVPMLLPLAYFGMRKNRLVITVISMIVILGIIITGKLFPLSLLLTHPPFSYLVVNYAFPSMLLLTAILAAFGLDNLIAMWQDDSKTIPKPALIASLIPAMAVLVFPLLAPALHVPLKCANFDLCLPDYAFNKADVLRYCIFALLAAAALLLTQFKKQQKLITAAIGLVLISQAALIFCANKSMPRRPGFAYKEEQILPALSKSCGEGGERFIATGSHLLRPNSNCVFKINDLRTHNPIFPRRYLAYMKACGAHLDEFNQEFESPLSPLLSLASVDTVLSQTAVTGEAEWAEAAEKAATTPDPEVIASRKAIMIEDGLKLDIRNLVVDNARKAIFTNIAFSGSKGRAGELTYTAAVYDEKGETLWFSDRLPLAGAIDKKQFAAIPSVVSDRAQTLFVAIQIFDNKKNDWIRSDSANLTARDFEPFKTVLQKLDSAFVVAAVKTERSAKSADSEKNYSLTTDTNNHERLYKNNAALPRVYSVHQIKIVDSPEAALQALNDKEVLAGKVAVIDKSDREAFNAAPVDNASFPLVESDEVKIIDWKPTEIVVAASTKAPGHLILTNIFYPGWHVYVDGREKTIVRANYLMQSVAVAAGKHVVRFAFSPFSFTLGLILFAAALLTGAIIAVRARLTTRRNDRKESSPE